MIRAIHKRLEEREEGFTLIELLVVVIIIGILAAIAIPVFMNQRQRAFRAAVQSDLRNAAVEIETHFTDNQTYENFTLGDLNLSTGVSIVAPADTSGWGATYCISMTHTNLSENWQISPGNQLVTGTC